MKILLVNMWRVVNAKGGTEKVFCNMANELARRGHTVKAICSDPLEGKPGFFLSDQVEFCNVFNKEKNNKKRSLFLSRPFINLRALLIFNREKRHDFRQHCLAQIHAAKLEEDVADFAPDVICAFQPEATYVLKKVMKIHCPVVTMFHMAPDMLKQRDCYPQGIAYSDVVQVLLPEFVEITKKLFGNKHVVCIPNVVPRYLNFSKCNEKKIINIARINRRDKRQHLLIEAFALLKEKFPDWQLEFWGETHLDEEYTELLKSKIRDFELCNRVTLCGTTDSVEDVCMSASIFGFPSRSEGFGLAMAEAMSAGLPVVVCKGCSGVSSLVKDGKNGFFCDSTPEDMAAKLEMLMRSEELRQTMGKKARESMSQYSAEKVWNQWEQLFKEMVNKN